MPPLNSGTGLPDFPPAPKYHPSKPNLHMTQDTITFAFSPKSSTFDGLLKNTSPDIHHLEV